TKGKEKILDVFFSDPFHEFYPQEVSKLSKSPYGRTHQYLNEFLKEDYFEFRRAGNMTFFRLKIENPIVLKIMELYEARRTEQFFKRNAKFKRALTQFTESLIAASHFEIHLIGLYGSLARGEWTSKSDIDILLVHSDKMTKNELNEYVKQASASIEGLYQLSHVALTISDFAETMREKKPFFQNFFQDRIILFNEFIFWHLFKKFWVKP
ncbi:MAG: nucleotidyltransferase domain-containing protein, partial [Deltaproteobacteria bacterium]|nr:nucleotidyltransferase domain-containing protein [Deltaproteobacteria bacterium]